MSHASATVYANKLAVAQRQLRAAIRMFFAGEDELAVHAVAYNAYGVLRDLKRGREGKAVPKPHEKAEAYGKDEARDLHLLSFVQLIREYREGSLPSEVAQNDELLMQIRQASDRLPAGPVNPDELQITLSGFDFKSFWTRRSHVGNFLKHADRDPDSHVDLDSLNNLELLAHALWLYLALVPNDLGPEGFVLGVYLATETGRIQGFDDARIRAHVNEVSKLSRSDRLLYCSNLVEKFREGGVFGAPAP